MVDIQSVMSGILKPIAAVLSESFSSIKPLFKDIKGLPTKKVKEIGKTFKSIGAMAMGPISMIMSVLDAFGIAEPFLEAFSGILAIIGGSIMEALMPALKKFMDILFSPDMIALWVLLGKIIGEMLAPILLVFAVVLKALMPIIKILLELFGPLLVPVITFLAKALGMLILIGLMPLVGAIYIVGYAVAALIDFFSLGAAKARKRWKSSMGRVMGTLLSGVGEIMAMQHGGIVTRPTIALLGEKGPELITPLGPEGFPVGQETSNEEVIWALEDNGEKLDMIYMTLKQKGRLK